jgi:hypothetical protein
VLAAHGVRLDEARNVASQAGAHPDTITFEEVSTPIEQIKELVRQLARLPSGGTEARFLTDRILRALDALTRPPGESGRLFSSGWCVMRSVDGYRSFAIAVFVCACVAAVAGQARQPPAPATADEQLLAEVRALRTEIADSANAAMRAQLLGMRLQLQEQRIGVIVRQLSDVQERVRSNDRAKDALAAQMRMFEGMVKTESQEKGEEFDRVIEPLRAQLAILETSDQSFKAEEASISSMLAQEQARWSNFNAQVEELERAAIRKPLR